MNISFAGMWIISDNISRSKEFYEAVLDQKVKYDYGSCQQFENGLTIMTRDSVMDIFGVDMEKGIQRSRSFVLTFETEDFSDFVQRLKSYDSVEYIHDVTEFDWGQRSICFYDPDQNMIDVSESMPSVCKRFSAQGMTAEEIAARTEHPVDFVNACIQ